MATTSNGGSRGEFDPGAGNLLGSNDLQQSLDSLTSAVNNLTTAFQGANQANGMTTSPATATQAEGATFSSRPGMGSTLAAFVGGGGGQGGSGGGPVQSNATQPRAGGGARIGGSGGTSGNGMPTIGQMAGTAVASFQNAANSSTNNMLLYNAFGQAMQYQWGVGAQNAQNQAFGNGQNSVNYAAAGNAQQAAQVYGQIAQMTGGQVTGTGALNMTNALAMSNPGMSYAAAGQLAGTTYNGARAFTQQMLTGVAAINPQTGAQVPIGQQLTQLAQGGYIAGFNANTGRFNQKTLNQSFNSTSGHTYSNLSNLGYSSSQIQDIQSMMSEANQVAGKANTSDQTVMNYLSEAGGGPGVSKQQADTADKWLQQHGYKQSTITTQGRLASQQMGQQQSESSSFNDVVSSATSAMQNFTNAVNTFLDKTGLNKLIGAGKGATSSADPFSGMISAGIGMISNLAGMGGGAASVSTTQQMGGKSSGSSGGGAVSGQVQTAVADAEQQIGKPYKYGGSNPQTSFDCSGLVMWAYGQAGVKLPRTSEQQWAALKNKSIPLNQVREGDIVFQAGSDGSANAPGHEALMVSNNQIVEAPYTGANIRKRAYNPNEWQHAGRPVGSGGSPASGGSAVSSTGGSSLSQGNAGAGLTGSNGGDSDLGLTANADSMLFDGGGGGGNAPQTLTSGTSNGSGTSPAGASGGATTKGKLTASQIMSLWTENGGPAGAASNMAKIAMAESGDDPSAKQQGQPPETTGWGLYQITPTSGISQNGKYGNLLNATNNTKAAIALYKASGYKPWAADPVGASLTGLATGGPIVVGERGPELFVPQGSGNVLSAKQTTNLLRGNSAQTAQSPYTATAAAQLLLDPLTSANNHAAGSSGGGITFAQGAINVTIQTPGGAGGSGTSGIGFNTTSDTQALASAFQQGVEQAIQRTNLVQVIRQGNTG